MDEITKEVITSILKRLATMEDKIEKWKKEAPMPSGELASERAKSYLKSLGGIPNKYMLKEACAKEIDRLIAKKKVTDSHSESPEVTEPEEVDTEEAGIDEVGLI